MTFAVGQMGPITSITLSSTTATLPMQGRALPSTLTLTSTAAARAIEVSPDGTNFFTPAYDYSSANAIAVAIMAPVVSARFTGAAGNVARVQ